MFPTCKNQAKKPQILKFTGILIEEIILAYVRSLYSNLCLLSSLPQTLQIVENPGILLDVRTL